VIDSENNNRCEKSNYECNTNYTLFPEDICIDTCDENVFVTKEIKETKENKCGLCKDLFPDKPYKLFNSTGCIENTQENYYYLNKQLKIVGQCHDSCKTCTGPGMNECSSCRSGFVKENGTCVECFENCEECYASSVNETEQNCLKCKKGKFFQQGKGNCFDECPLGYYNNYTDNLCHECYMNCKSCSSRKENENENCLSCYENYSLIDIEGMDKNCVEECPNKTLEIDGKCVIDDTKKNYMLNIFFLLVLYIFIMMAIRAVINFLKNRKMNDYFYQQIEL